MSKTFRWIIAAALVIGASGNACSNQGSETADASTAGGDAVVAKADTRAAPDAPRPFDLAQAESSGDAYTRLLDELKILQQSATTRAKRLEVIGQTQARFETFLKMYAGSPEAADAHFQLGILNFSTSNNQKSVEHLEAFVAVAGGTEDDKVGYSHFYLGEAYKGMDKFDKAKMHYETYAAKYPTLNPRFLAVAQSSLQDMNVLKRLSIGSEPIAFDVKDLAGSRLSLAQYKGKVVLLDFWATWCGPCKAEMPNVIKLRRKYHDAGFEIVGISLDRDRGSLERYIKSNGMEWPQHFDGKGWSNGIAAMYKVRSIPATYLIDRSGKIRYRSLRGPALEKAVEELLREKA